MLKYITAAALIAVIFVVIVRIATLYREMSDLFDDIEGKS